MLRGRGLERRVSPFALPDTDLCRKQGGSPGPDHGKTGDGVEAEWAGGPVPLLGEYLRGTGTGLVHLIMGVRHLGADKGAAARGGVAARLERRLQEEKEAQWMASLNGPDRARGRKCSLI